MWKAIHSVIEYPSMGLGVQFVRHMRTRHRLAAFSRVTPSRSSTADKFDNKKDVSWTQDESTMPAYAEDEKKTTGVDIMMRSMTRPRRTTTLLSSKNSGGETSEI